MRNRQGQKPSASKSQRHRSEPKGAGKSAHVAAQALALFEARHAGETFIICGCGISLKTFTPPELTITIGVNDVGRQFTPDYLVVLNPKNQFKGDRFHYVENSQAKAVFTQLKLDIPHSQLVPIKLGKRAGIDCFDKAGLPFTRNSPYVALCLAIYMGAKRIGLIGVDFTEHHFFTNTGKHPLTAGLTQINAEYKNLYQAAQAKGIEIVNLSSNSKLDAFPKMGINQFLHPRAVSPLASVTGKPMNKSKDQPLAIVSYATSPVAGVPEILSRCINQYTEHASRCVWATNDYGNGVVFNSDVEWKSKPGEAVNLIKKADVVIVHNGKVLPEHRALLCNKPIITMAHNYMWNVDQQFVAAGYPGLVVGQYQATLKEFANWQVVPNPMPLVELTAQGQLPPGIDKNQAITICYTPSGKHDRYPKTHRLYWHSKGYATTTDILRKLARRYPIKLEIIEHKQLSLAEVLAMKQRAHIVIDECVTGSYHRNSLEGLACACVVINGIGILPGVEKAFKQCITLDQPGNALQDYALPFIGCGLENLESELIKLIEQGREALLQRGRQNYLWMAQHWHFANQWQAFWQPAVESAMRRNIIQSAPKTVPAKEIKIEKAKPVPATSGSDPHLIPLLVGAKVSMYWTCRTNSHGNFGDMLSPVISQALSGKSSIFKSAGPALFAAGSLLKFARAGDVVWGTGFIDAKDRCKPGVIIKAVRGPLTRELLLKQGIECPDIYGDPGLLLPALFRSPVKVQYRLGIIPHYVDLARVRKQINDPKICIIDIRSGIEQVIQLARSCEIILSSSLHGCILGDAYGIPTAWIELSDSVVGKGFKFRDYYASTDRDPVHVDCRKRLDLDQVVNRALNAAPAKINVAPLIDSFPFLSARADAFKNFTIGAHNINSHTLALLRTKTTGLNPVSDKLISSDDRNHNAQYRSTVNDCNPVIRITNESQALLPPKNRIALFGAVTENYVEYMIASLRSYIKHNDKGVFDYFILGRGFSPRTQRMISKHGIRYININLQNDFKRTSKHQYPGECFWIFKGPAIFHQLGYNYSLAVDGDTLCKKSLPLDWLHELNHIGGIDRGCSVGEFLRNIGQLNQLKHTMGLSQESLARTATNTGVLFFNNPALVNANFYGHMVDAYKHSETAGIVRGGDDSSLALLLAMHKEISLHILDDKWNLYKGLLEHHPTVKLNNAGHKTPISDALILHLSSIKPWHHHATFPSEDVQACVNEWRRLWPNTKNQRRLALLDHSVIKFAAINKLADHAISIKPALPNKTLGNTGSANPASTKTTANQTTVINAIVTSRRTTNKQPLAKPIAPQDCAIYWYRGAQPNMGDEVTPYLLSKLLSRPVSAIEKQRTTKPEQYPGPVLIAVGSVLRLCGKNSLVWGSGIRNIDQAINNAQEFCAVRGPLTRRRLLQLGYDCPPIYGDPALLLPRFYRPGTEKKFALGIIPHLVDYPLIAQRYAGRDDILIIDVRTTDIEAIVEKIVSCAATVSSSLHGIILSTAYNIPTRWLKCSDKIMGDDSKFYDFFASLEPRIETALNYKNLKLPAHHPVYDAYRPLMIGRQSVSVEELIASTFKFKLNLDLEKLLRAFPYQALGGTVQQAAKANITSTRNDSVCIIYS